MRVICHVVTCSVKLSKASIALVAMRVAIGSRKFNTNLRAVAFVAKLSHDSEMAESYGRDYSRCGSAASRGRRNARHLAPAAAARARAEADDQRRGVRVLPLVRLVGWTETV